MNENPGFYHPTSIKSESRFILHGCNISESKLDRLWSKAKEGVPEDACVSVTNTQKGRVETHVEANSIDSLLASLREDTFAENPNHMDNLQLRVSTANRSVSVRILAGRRISNEGVHVSVSGDEEWVRGRSSVLRELLEGTQSPLIAGRGHSRPALLLVGCAVAAGITSPIAGALSQHTSLGGALLLLFSLGALLGGVGFFMGSLLDRRNRTHLNLSAQSRRPNIDRMGIAGLIVGILGVIAVIISILVAHSDAIHPH
jgi:hypothetical protein